LKVAYDISVLGLGHFLSRARTGVFRVIENLALHLKDIQDLEMSFWSCRNKQQVIMAYQYLNETGFFKNIPYGESNGYMLNKLISSLAHSYSDPLTMPQRFKLNYNKIPFANCWKFILLKYLMARADKRFFQSSNIDIFHTPFYPIPKKITKAKRFLTVYDLIPLLFPQYFQFNENHLIKQVVESIRPDDWVLAISHSTKNDLCGYSKNVDPDKVTVTHLAASDLFYPCEDNELRQVVRKNYDIPDGPYILSLSTLEPRKNIDMVIKSFARIVQQEKINDLNLVLAGTKGWDYDKIFDELNNVEKIRERIIFTGYVADEDLAALYSDALMFVYPSFYEGFGLPPLEAMQCGVPVITSNTSSLPEVIEESGIMIDPNDMDSLSENIIKIYQNSELAKSLSAKSLIQAKKFSWKNCAGQTMASYKRSLA